jgi:hypothetical protein
MLPRAVSRRCVTVRPQSARLGPLTLIFFLFRADLRAVSLSVIGLQGGGGEWWSQGGGGGRRSVDDGGGEAVSRLGFAGCREVVSATFSGV